MLLNCRKLLKYKSCKSFNAIINRNLTVLGIETSCDDTGIAIVRHENNKNTVLGNVLNSQQSFHIR